MKKVHLSDFLKDHEIKQALFLRTKAKIKERLIIPNLERINASLGQENNPDYLAYAVEYVVSQYNQGLSKVL